MRADPKYRVYALLLSDDEASPFASGSEEEGDEEDSQKVNG